VNRANRALVTAVGDRAIVQADFYASRLPGPRDFLLIVEIAESSLHYDLEVKSRIYADAGVSEYWLVDLDRRSVSCYTEPGSGAYHTVRQYHSGQSIAPMGLPECAIHVDALLAG
jgi:Uma2 family endonuclease